MLEHLVLDAIFNGCQNFTSQIIDAFCNDSPSNSQFLSITIKDVFERFLGAHQRYDSFDLLGFGAFFILHRLADILLYFSQLLKSGFSVQICLQSVVQFVCYCDEVKLENFFWSQVLISFLRLALKELNCIKFLDLE